QQRSAKRVNYCFPHAGLLIRIFANTLRSDMGCFSPHGVSRATNASELRPNRYRVLVPRLLGRQSRTTERPTSPGRHRNSPDKEADSVVEDHELTSYLAALAPEADPDSTGSGARFGEGEVHQLRMTPVASQQLKEIAEARGTSPQALAREWVLERLSWESQTSSAQAQRQLAHDEQHTDQHFFGGQLAEPAS